MKGAANKKIGYYGLAVFLGLGLLALAWHLSQPSSAPPVGRASELLREHYQGDPEAGKKVYQKHCKYCHGEKGRGDGAIAIALEPRPTDFVGDTERMAAPAEELFEAITNGIGEGERLYMPAWGDILSARQRWDVLAYIRSLARPGIKDNLVDEIMVPRTP